MNNPEIKVEFSNLKEYKSDEESDEKTEKPEGKAQGGTSDQPKITSSKRRGQSEMAKSKKAADLEELSGWLSQKEL